MLVNHAGAASGLPSCIEATSLGIVQDDDDGSLWSALGMTGNGFVVIDALGTLVYRDVGATLPTDEDAIVLVVTSVLESN